MHSVAEREILWNLGPERFFVYPLLFLAIAYTLSGFWQHARLWLIGKGPVPTDHLAARANTVLQYALGHRRIAFGYREAYAGLMHASIFAGFMTLVFVTTVIAIEDWVWIMFKWSFLHGPVYLGYSLIGDLGGLLLLFGVGLAFYRRYVQHADRVGRRSPTSDDGRALAVLAFLAVNGFAIEGIRILMTELADHRTWAMWSPVGMAFASFFGLFGLGADALSVLHRFAWVTHLVTVALFIAMIPNTKFAHIILSSAAMFFRDPVRNSQAKGALVAIQDIELKLEQEETLGVTKLVEFRFDQLVQFDGCTNCGRCQDNCPAYLSGKPLSPRKLIQDLRVHMLDVGPIVADGGAIPEEKKLVGVTIAEDTLWSCVTCRACMEACPVLIEHIPAIVDMRRGIVMMGEGEIPDTAQAALVNMERRGNPWRGSQHVRGDWMEKAGDVPEFTDGNETEYLFWVGCTGALEDRAQKVTLATIQVLQAAGVNFGVLGPEETCTGDPARRMGNEYLFQTMAQQTIEILQSRNTKKIITNCPHCFNTFKNEYPQLGGHFEVVHHTQIINEVMKSGKLRMRYGVESGDAAGAQPVITYHDSCYLGRHNGEFEAPREIVAGLPGVESVVEMERNRAKSFCCGAGGGHMWMDLRLGENINRMRSEQASNTGANIVATACPFCAIMFEDGIKQIDRTDQLKVMDVAELVAQTLDLPQPANATEARA